MAKTFDVDTSSTHNMPFQYAFILDWGEHWLFDYYNHIIVEIWLKFAMWGISGVVYLHKDATIP